MKNTTFNSRSNDSRLKAKLAPYRSAGHEDVRTGFGYRPEYDRWNEAQQRAYENGRLVAMNVKTAGFDLPVWRDGVTRPRGFQAVHQAASKLTGFASVLTRQPEAA